MIEAQTRIDPDGSGYRDCSQTNRYTHDIGLVVLPVASRESAHRIIRLHGGVAMRTVAWRSARTGSPPMIPAATDTYGDTLLSTQVIPSLPTTNDDQRGFDWLVEGEYVYVQNAPRIAGSSAFHAGNYPFITVSQALAGAKQVSASRVRNIVDNDQVTDKLGAVSALAVQGATIHPNGTVSWPFTFLPPEASSTHLIGG